MLSFFRLKNSTIVRAINWYSELDWLPDFTITLTEAELMADLHTGRDR